MPSTKKTRPADMDDSELERAFTALASKWHDGGQTRRVVVGRIIDEVLDERLARR